MSLLAALAPTPPVALPEAVGTSNRRAVLRVAALAVLVAAAALTLRVLGTDPGIQAHQETLTSLYTPPSNAAEAILNQHDGQHAAALALDPTLRDHSVFGSREEHAYRAARPLMGWLAALGSLGFAAAVPWVLLALTAIGTGALVAGVALLAQQSGRRVDLALLAIALPGAVVQLGWAGLADNLAVGATLAGLAWWSRGQTRWAVAAFCLAALGRETTLVVPAAIVLAELSARTPWRRLLPLVTPVALLAGWTCVVRWRIGVWPSGAGDSRIGTPWTGLGVAAGRWDAADVAVLVGVAALLVAACRRRVPRAHLLVVGLSLAGALFLGWNVWERWEDVTRVLLPACAVALVALLPGEPPSDRRRAHDRSDVRLGEELGG